MDEICNLNTYAKLFILDLGINWAMAVPSIIFKTERYYDLTGAITNITLAVTSYALSPKHSTRQLVQSFMAATWAARLGIFLFRRILKDGHDKRFNEAKQKPARLFTFWTVQGLWCFITLLPTIMLNEQTRNPPLGPQDYIGWSMYVFGIVFEVTADVQKTVFRGKSENAGKFIKTGLWSISRHPNYFGEIVLWSGLFISASSVFRGWQFLSVLSPVFVYLLLTRLSGIPLLEKPADKKWGDSDEYQEYKRKTPVLFPFLNYVGLGELR